MNTEKQITEKIIPEENSTIGTVCVHESVLSAIIKKAACSVKGVTRLAGGSFVDNLVEIAGPRKLFERSIAIEILNKAVRIEVRIVVEYGKFIPAVAAAVRKTILREINVMTGMNIENLDVIVMDVDIPEKTPSGNPKENSSAS